MQESCRSPQSQPWGRFPEDRASLLCPERGVAVTQCDIDVAVFAGLRCQRSVDPAASDPRDCRAAIAFGDLNRASRHGALGAGRRLGMQVADALSYERRQPVVCKSRPAGRGIEPSP